MKPQTYLNIDIRHLGYLLGIILLLQSCVFTKKPLPSAQYPNITLIPKNWEGVYQKAGDEKAYLIGERYTEVKRLTPHQMVKTSYKVFTKEMIQKHPHPEYFQIVGDFLWYYNDTLKNQLDALIKKSDLSAEEAQIKKELKEYDEKVGFHQVFKLKRKGKLYIYDEKLEHYLDLKKGILKTFPYTKSWEQKTYEVNLKKRGNVYYLNVRTEFPEKADKKNKELKYDWYRWFTVWIIDKAPDLSIKIINYESIWDQADYYQKITPIQKPSPKYISMNPSVKALEKIEQAPGFFKAMKYLKRVELEGQAVSNDVPESVDTPSLIQYWHIAFLMVALLTSVILLLRQWLVKRARKRKI
ncbi:hypothetical protein BKI52_24255 [marine bacterium AO1-C]|nr:hypothetical protein BKI52_24255 [marine bacterium AO1-C]